jgi:radical SAM family RiPP maturation amino acid epimerase
MPAGLHVSPCQQESPAWRDHPLRNRSAEDYRRIVDSRTSGEIRTLAHLKRLWERYFGDYRFRKMLREDLAAAEVAARACGIDVPLEPALPILCPDGQRNFADGERWALARMWNQYQSDLSNWARGYNQYGATPDSNPRFDAWRRRQIARCRTMLSGGSRHLPHSILAFELSQGCSVGCWFCGVSARRLRANFRYTDENAQLWRAVLEQAVALFGVAAQTGFCYWATDPSDNPDYPEFLEDYWRVTGALPQTTTAMPLRNLDFTRRIMELYERYRCVNNRFSVLNLKTLDALHATFTAEELMTVDLVLQNPETGMAKVNIGRALEWRGRRRGVPEFEPAIDIVNSQNTIACVTGFLISMVTRTIQMITPAPTGERCPLGYWIVGESRFDDARSFRSAIDALIAYDPGSDLGHGRRLRFRKDLVYSREPGGFSLQCPVKRFTIRGFAGADQLGDLIASGNTTADQIHAALATAGADVIIVAAALGDLLEAGLLDEDPTCPERQQNQLTR